MTFQRLCIFCGSSPGNRLAYHEAAMATGELLAERNIELVYGGGRVGLMGMLADAVLSAGGRVVGVIPDFMIPKEVAHQGLSDLRIVGSMHERKALMSDLSDGFIALPGGFGTFEEFCEVLTWSQLGLQAKPCGLLNIEGYYTSLLDLFDHAMREGFVHLENRKLVLDEGSPEQLLQKMTAFSPNSTGQSIRRDER